ncbi:MAG: helix-turn-helix domain-containing protein [Bdellovibrionaceae bacterium]|nr:helix-turn-helix domain-containing protein [Pseudobdellovibrionaceae bacterium]
MFNGQTLKRNFLEASEAAFLLGIETKTLYNWKLAGKIKAINLGRTTRGRLRISIAEVERLLGGKISITEEPNVDK